jgi:hypothetical protein
MKNSCEGVTNESAILAFIDSLERGQLLHHHLLRERNEGKLTLNSMITIASNYAATDDDARESLKASAIQNTGKRNSSNKRENYREEPITFEVVPFKSTYHVIFGRPAFHSFHARPCYIYNQLKMPGPDGIITVYGSFRKAKECEEGEAAFTKAVFFGEEFKEIHAAMDLTEMPASKQEVSASPPTFKPIVDTKQVELVAGDATKTTSIGTNLSPK